MLHKHIPDDVWAKGKSSGFFYHITEGTGDNLLKEDVDEGYVDYIYYDYYKSLNDIHEDEAYDGGQILLKEYYQSKTLKQILKAVAEFEDEEELELIEVVH